MPPPPRAQPRACWPALARAASRSSDSIGSPPTDGWFHTLLFQDPEQAARYGSAGYGSIDAAGQPQLQPERVFNAHILRFAYLYGIERSWREQLERLLAAELELPLEQGSAHHPSPACFFHALARAVRVSFPAASQQRLLVPLCARILASRDGGFGGPLSTALAVLAMHDLDRGEQLGPESLATLCAAVLDRARVEPYFVGELGSEPFNFALIAAALARASVCFPEEALA
jgi:hypothetical protein